MKSRSLVIMSETNDTSKRGDAKLENRVLTDSELAAVTGGRIPTKHPAKVTVPDIKLSIS
jgi:bacteriocin-like protein